MLLKEINSKNWKDAFSTKFVSFSKKCPVLISFNIVIQGGEEGALVSHVNSGKKYFFPFEYDTKVSDFIFKIKTLLIQNHYPRVVEEILEKHEFTKEELAIQLENKSVDDLSKYEMRAVGTRQFRIDRVLLWKNLFLLVLENSSFEDDEIGKIYRYKINISPVIFLKNYRSGKFPDLETASRFFFSNSVLIDSLDKKDENK